MCRVRNPWLGLDSSADPVGLARLLMRAHERALAGGGSEAILRDVVTRSWERSRLAGVNPDRHDAPLLHERRDVAERWRTHPLARFAPLVRENLSRLRLRRPAHRRHRRRGRLSAVVRRASQRARRVGGHRLRPRPALARGGDGDERRRHRDRRRPPGPDLLRRALQPQHPRVDLLRRAGARPRDRQGARDHRPVQRDPRRAPAFARARDGDRADGRGAAERRPHATPRAAAGPVLRARRTWRGDAVRARRPHRPRAGLPPARRRSPGDWSRRRAGAGARSAASGWTASRSATARSSCRRASRRGARARCACGRSGATRSRPPSPATGSCCRAGAARSSCCSRCTPRA